MVRVTFTDGKEPVDYQDADSFGFSEVGDLILVKIHETQVPGPQGMQLQTVGKNLLAIASGRWSQVEAHENKVQTPGQVIIPGMRQ